MNRTLVSLNFYHISYLYNQVAILYNNNPIIISDAKGGRNTYRKYRKIHQILLGLLRVIYNLN